MKAIVAYSYPRGIYGRCVFTVVIEYNLFFDEHSDIQMLRPQETTAYRCSSCGRWATITTVTDVGINAGEHRDTGQLELYRFDNVEPGDHMEIRMSDSDLLFAQQTNVYVPQAVAWGQLAAYPSRQPKQQKQVQQTPHLQSRCYPVRQNSHLGVPPTQLYDVHLINWDEYLQQNPLHNRTVRVEEDLINRTMRAEPITITQLLLTPQRQSASEDGARFIEGELRYL